MSLLWVSVPLAWAGDKIEFSAPAGPAAVPQLEVENKDAANPTSLSLIPDHSPEMDAALAPPMTETVIIGPEKKKDSWSRDSDSFGNRNGENDFDRKEYDPFAEPQLFPTNRWSVQQAWVPAQPNFQKRGEDGQQPDSLRARIEADGKNANGDSFHEDRFGLRSGDSEEDSAWVRSAFPHAFPSLDRMRSGQFVPFESEKMDMEQAQPAAVPASSGSALQYDYGTAPGMAEYSSQLDALHGRSQDESQSMPHLLRSSETRTAQQSSHNYFEAQAEAARSFAPSRPAVLPFPKKPGDLLQ